MVAFSRRCLLCLRSVLLPLRSLRTVACMDISRCGYRLTEEPISACRLLAHRCFVILTPGAEIRSGLDTAVNSPPHFDVYCQGTFRFRQIAGPNWKVY